jgi:predicted HAD superfamily Cof-like phosphohydrolase
MREAQERVRRFHDAMAKLGARLSGAVGDPEYPGIVDPALARLRSNLLLEECTETMISLVGREETERMLIRCVRELDDVKDTCGDPVAQADGLADTIVIALGTSAAGGFIMAPIFNEVMDANDRKVGSGATVRHDGKLLKPADWRGPDIAAVLARQKEQAR